MNEIDISRNPVIDATKLLGSTLLELMRNEPLEGRIFDTVPKVLIACMPKSGSTWFTALLERGLGLPVMRGYAQPDRNEQEFDALALFQSLDKQVIFAQQHVRASETTLRLCRAFSVKTICLTRHIDDAIVSFRDHLENESTVASMFYMEPEWFRRLPKGRQLDFLIDHCAPWYLNFSVGWLRAMQSSREMILLVQYERLISEPSAVVDEVSQFLGRPLNVDAASLELHDGVRFNQGRAGRGKEELSAAQQQRISSLADYYDQLDLSLIGLNR
jgi:hypothetical protein